MWGEGEDDVEQGDYVAQMFSIEKGCFFEGTITTVGEFNINKLKLFVNEYPNGDDIIDNIEYNDVDVENEGGDTNGKGYAAAVWSNKD